MEKRLVFVLAVAMVVVAIGGAVAEAGTVFKAANYASPADTSQWLVIQPLPGNLSVSTQGALVTPCIDDPETEEVETCTANNTFLLLVLGISVTGELHLDLDNSSPTSPGANPPPDGCPPPASGYSGEVFAPGVFAALVVEKVFQALDGCDFCLAYTQFTSETLAITVNLSGADACGL